MQSYERLQNNYYSQFAPSLQARTLLFKGKTQKGLCTHSSQYQKLWEEGKTPKNECETCPDVSKCAYQKQIQSIEEFKESKQGFCILTTDKNLNNILSRTKGLDPVIIIDDISLASIITPETEITRYKLEALYHHLQKHASRAKCLCELISLLTDDNDEIEATISIFLEKHNDQLFGELSKFQVGASGGSELPSHPSMNFVANLLYWNKNGHTIHFYSEYKKLKIVADATAEYQPKKIIYLNATPSFKDKYCIARLGNCKRLEGKVEIQKRYYIFQIIDSATTKQAILTSSRMKADFQVLTNIIKPPLGFTGQKLLLFGHDEVLDNWGKEGIFSGLETSFEIYFGSGTRGTNDYKDYPIAFLIGTPYYPPEYFLHPAFEPHWKSEEERAKEREKNPGAPLYYVPRNISDQEAQINLLQMIGRNLRESEENPDAVKIVVVFTSVDITEACKKQNGGNVFKINIRSEIPIIRGEKKGKTPNIDALKRACQAALRPQILKKIEKHVDLTISKNDNSPIQLQPTATGLHKQIEIYDIEGIKKLIKERYKTQNLRIKNGVKQVLSAFIVKKNA